jgi:hypothetical protein
VVEVFHAPHPELGGGLLVGGEHFCTGRRPGQRLCRSHRNRTHRNTYQRTRTPALALFHDLALQGSAAPFQGSARPFPAIPSTSRAFPCRARPLTCAPTKRHVPLQQELGLLAPGFATRRPAPPAAQRAGGADSVVLAVRQHQRHSLCCPLFGPLFGLPQGSLQPFAVVAPLAHADNRQQTKANAATFRAPAAAIPSGTTSAAPIPFNSLSPPRPLVAYQCGEGVNEIRTSFCIDGAAKSHLGRNPPSLSKTIVFFGFIFSQTMALRNLHTTCQGMACE